MNGNALAVARKLRGQTQTELGKAIGISQRSISKFEKNECEPSEKTLALLAKELGFPISFFLITI